MTLISNEKSPKASVAREDRQVWQTLRRRIRDANDPRQICRSYHVKDDDYWPKHYLKEAHPLTLVYESLFQLNRYEKANDIRAKYTKEHAVAAVQALYDGGDPLTKALFGKEVTRIDFNALRRHTYLPLLYYRYHFVHDFAHFVEERTEEPTHVPFEIADFALYHGDHLRREYHVEDRSILNILGPVLNHFSSHCDSKVSRHFATAWLSCAVSVIAYDEASVVFQMLGCDPHQGKDLSLESIENLRRTFTDFPPLLPKKELTPEQRLPPIVTLVSDIGDAQLNKILEHISRERVSEKSPLMDLWLSHHPVVEAARSEASKGWRLYDPFFVKKLEPVYCLCAEIVNPKAAFAGRESLKMLAMARCGEYPWKYDVDSSVMELFKEAGLSFPRMHESIHGAAGPIVALLNRYDEIPSDGPERTRLIDDLRLHAFICLFRSNPYMCRRPTLDKLVEMPDLSFLLCKVSNQQGVLESWLHSPFFIDELKTLYMTSSPDAITDSQSWSDYFQKLLKLPANDWFGNYLEAAWFLPGHS